MTLMEKLKERFVLFGVIILLIASAILNINSYSNINTMEREIRETTIGFDNTHICEERLDAFPDGLYCFSLSDSKKTCYTLPDRKGGKRCLVEPFWEEIIYEDGCPEAVCPLTECPTCPAPQPCPTLPGCPTCPDCNSCCSGGGGGSCPTTCPPQLKCGKVEVLAYVPNEDCSDTIKWFCDDIGMDANCVQDETLEVPFGIW